MEGKGNSLVVLSQLSDPLLGGPQNSLVERVVLVNGVPNEMLQCHAQH